jgi:hypothetical protein
MRDCSRKQSAKIEFSGSVCSGFKDDILFIRKELNSNRQK